MFAGGDAVSGPATVIRAVAAGKVAAANIDSFLGFNHKIRTDVEVPPAHLTSMPPCGRVNLHRPERWSATPGTSHLLKEGMTDEEATQEASRCLRCDHFGYGSLQGRKEQGMVNLTIDGRSAQVPEGTTILEAARQADIHIPHLCYLKGHQ